MYSCITNISYIFFDIESTPNEVVLKKIAKGVKILHQE